MWRDSETEIDYLDYGYIVDIMIDTINDEKLLPSCIGLYGDWGSGKTGLMHMCIVLLRKTLLEDILAVSSKAGRWAVIVCCNQYSKLGTIKF